MARSFKAQQIASALLDEADSYDVRMNRRRDGTVDVAVIGPRKAIKLGKIKQRGNKWKVFQVLHNIGRAGRCRLDGYFDNSKKAASCLAMATAPIWKAILADQNVPDDLREAEEPTDAQKEAGNYQKEHIKWEGFDISIENEKGSKRGGKDPNGKSWSVTMPADYGYFRRTEGHDGDHVDCYIGDCEDAHYVYIVDQIDLKTNKFDEHKCLICFPDLDTATKTYKKGFSDGKADQRMGEIATMTVDEFKEWLKGSSTKRPVKWKRMDEGLDDPKDFLMSVPDTGNDVYNATGVPVRRSRNLRGLRQHIAHNLVDRVSIYPISGGQGVLEVMFANGDVHRGQWADFGMIKNSLRNWRNLYGAPLFINGAPAGQVRWNNERLAESKEWLLQQPLGMTPKDKEEARRAFRRNFTAIKIGDNSVVAHDSYEGYTWEYQVGRDKGDPTMYGTVTRWRDREGEPHSLEDEPVQTELESKPGESVTDFTWRVMDASDKLDD